jgi:hypothetical protein
VNDTGWYPDGQEWDKAHHWLPDGRCACYAALDRVTARIREQEQGDTMGFVKRQNVANSERTIRAAMDE